MTTPSTEQPWYELMLRWCQQYHEEPSPCGSNYCRDGTMVQLEERFAGGGGRTYTEIECPMCVQAREANR